MADLSLADLQERRNFYAMRDSILVQALDELIRRREDEDRIREKSAL